MHRRIKLDQVVYLLVLVYTSHKKIAGSQGWQEFWQLTSLTELIMFISSASGFYLLSFLGYYAGHTFSYARQLLVNVRVSGLCASNHNWDGFRVARSRAAASGWHN
jgi:hypothetical protein